MGYQKPELFVLKVAGKAVQQIDNLGGNGAKLSNAQESVYEMDDRGSGNCTSSTGGAYEADE